MFFQRTKFDAFDFLLYFGSILIRDGSLDSEIDLESSLSKARFNVNESYVLFAPSYSSETWTPYRRDIIALVISPQEDPKHQILPVGFGCRIH